ncbi:MAG: molybdopterin synthase sulfur carrier subunit [Gammaproteobacteria bacterium]|nr:MAG: molybdopterin synthase sulfur carrier subunit [Gammaproteobacteria bacterium]
MINIKVLFFANFRELLGCSSMSVELKANADIGDLCDAIKEKGENWSALFSNVQSNVKTDLQSKLMIAVNQEMTTLEYSLKNGDEVAFFPPVTGG